MSSINKWIGTGNLTRDPEVAASANGSWRANFGVACNRKYTKDGQPFEEVTFVDCTAFGRTAEIVGQYLKKGSKVGIVGRLFLNQWNAQDGSKRSKLTVTVEGLEMLDKAPQQGQGYHPQQQYVPQPQQQQFQQQQPIQSGPPAWAQQQQPQQQPQQQQFVGPNDTPF